MGIEMNDGYLNAEPSALAEGFAFFYFVLAMAAISMLALSGRS